MWVSAHNDIKGNGLIKGKGNNEILFMSLIYPPLILSTDCLFFRWIIFPYMFHPMSLYVPFPISFTYNKNVKVITK